MALISNENALFGTVIVIEPDDWPGGTWMTVVDGVSTGDVSVTVNVSVTEPLSASSIWAVSPGSSPPGAAGVSSWTVEKLAGI